MSKDAPLEGTPLIAPSSIEHPLYDSVVESIRTVYDPEIPVNIYDLGLIYTININNDGTMVVVGDYKYNTERGRVQVFELDTNNNWTQKGSDVLGSSSQ